MIVAGEQQIYGENLSIYEGISISQSSLPA
jgi:hypothetical protein